MSVELTFLEGAKWHQSGDLEKAGVCYRAVLAVDPGHPGALHYSGLLAFQQGRFAEAQADIERAIKAFTAFPGGVPAECYINLGNALKRQERTAEAVSAYQTATRIRPEIAAGWYNLGLLQRLLGQYCDAVQSLEVASRLQPHSISTWVELGECSYLSGNERQALRFFDQAIPLVRKPQTGQEQLNYALRIARILIELRRFDAAATLLETPHLRNAKEVEFLNLIGCAYIGQGRLTDAERSLQEAHLLSPQDERVTDNLACLQKDAGHIEAALGLFRELADRKALTPSIWSNYLFTLLYSDQVSCETLLTEHQRAAPDFELLDPFVTPTRSIMACHRPIRVGYLSGDLHNHPVAYFLLSILQNHHPDAVSVHVYDNGPVADEWTQRLQANTASWSQIRALDDRQLARRIQEDKIDVLVDLSGHTAHNRLGALSLHPARVQASYLGYSFSTGMPWIDWRIVDVKTDPLFVPACATEKLYRLPRSYYCYSEPQDAPSIGPLPALSGGGVNFGVFSNLAKVSDATLDFWAQVLRSTPRATLYWRAKAFADKAVQKRMANALMARDVDRKKLQFEAWAPHRDRWLAFRNVDVALDTFPYNQATSTCEALWMGVPTLNLAGPAHMSRMGASILSAVGLEDWVFEVDDFKTNAKGLLERIAKLLEPGPLGVIRESLRYRLRESKLMDGDDLARSLEEAYAHMLSACH